MPPAIARAISAGGLHAFTGVAELKPARVSRREQAAVQRLHAFTGVAELKRRRLGLLLRRVVARLHAFTGVAELKLGRGHAHAGRVAASPRLHRRGRIEAVNTAPPIAITAEAGLHAFTGVAELKPHGPTGRRPRRPRLHAFTGVAELKRVQLGDVRGLGRRVSTPSPAWPN